MKFFTITLSPNALPDVGQFGDHLADAPLVISQLHAAQRRRAARRASSPQRLQAPHAPLVARAPRLHAFANPHLFLRQQFVELWR